MKVRIEKNIWSWVGVCVGVIILTVGIVFCSSAPESYNTKSVEDVSFGADFYTYEYAATRIAASNAAIAANNIRELGMFFAKYAGFFFIAMGLLVILHYIKDCIKFIAIEPVQLLGTEKNGKDHPNEYRDTFVVSSAQKDFDSVYSNAWK